MDIPDFLGGLVEAKYQTIEMHTGGEPTRIVYSGFPDVTGTLLEQRAKAKAQHDHVRRALICEPRGHREMYGAILRPRTEYVDAGKAHMGVLFLTNDGYSIMCGHATLAVARMLVDYSGSGSDLFSFPSRSELHLDEKTQQIEVVLHVPCGLVQASVPAIRTQSGKFRADPKRPISYMSVPSFASGLDVDIPIPPSLRWPELGERASVKVDVSYGGTFFLLAPASALGFSSSLAASKLSSLDVATKQLKAAFNASEELRATFLRHPQHEDLQFLYSVILTEVDESSDEETGLCFFADQQVDRSPTGSGVQARVAVAHARGTRRVGEKRTYHTLLSKAYGGEGSFVGELASEVEFGGRKAVLVKVSGFANYTGCSSHILEKQDTIGKGFWFGEPRGGG